MSNENQSHPQRRRAVPSSRVADSAESFRTLQSLKDFQESNSAIFPSLSSVRWFYRKHRATLLQAGAVVEIAGRLFVDGPTFAKKAVKIGAKIAGAR